LKRYAHISETLKRDETSEVVQTRESEREVHVTCECGHGCAASWDLPSTLVFDLLIDHRQNRPNIKDNGALPALTLGSQSSQSEIKLGRN